MTVLRPLSVLVAVGALVGCASSADDSDSSNAAVSAAPAQACATSMIAKPIAPPSIAGLDLAGALSLDAAESANCPSAEVYRDGSYVTSGWSIPRSDADDARPFVPITVDWDSTSRSVLSVSVSPGYTGTMEFHSRAGDHKYSLSFDKGLVKDDQPMTLDWSNIQPQANEIYDAILATFAPDKAGVQDCLASGDCKAEPYARTALAHIDVIPLKLRLAVLAVSSDNRTNVEMVTLYSSPDAMTAADAR